MAQRGPATFGKVLVRRQAEPKEVMPLPRTGAPRTIGVAATLEAARSAWLVIPGSTRGCRVVNVQSRHRHPTNHRLRSSYRAPALGQYAGLVVLDQCIAGGQLQLNSPADPRSTILPGRKTYWAWTWWATMSIWPVPPTNDLTDVPDLVYLAGLDLPADQDLVAAWIFRI